MLRAMQAELVAELERLVADAAEARANLIEITRALCACRERLAGGAASTGEPIDAAPPTLDPTT